MLLRVLRVAGGAVHVQYFLWNSLSPDRPVLYSNRANPGRFCGHKTVAINFLLIPAKCFILFSKTKMVTRKRQYGLRFYRWEKGAFLFDPKLAIFYPINKSVAYCQQQVWKTWFKTLVNAKQGEGFSTSQYKIRVTTHSTLNRQENTAFKRLSYSRNLRTFTAPPIGQNLFSWHMTSQPQGRTAIFDFLWWCLIYFGNIVWFW